MLTPIVLSLSLGLAQAAPVRRVDVEAQATLVVSVAEAELPARASANARKLSASLVAALREGDEAKAKVVWQQVLAAYDSAHLPSDVNQLVQWVLRQSYLENTSDLRHYAQKVQFFNDAKKQVRDHVRRLRNQAAAAKQDDQPTVRVRQVLVNRKYTTGARPVTLTKTVTMTREQAASYIAEIEAQLNTLNDDAQLANVDLQNTLQKQQQTLQMMSNISKMLHDTAMSTIRKIGG
jgi:hypothetical protein